MKAKHYVVKEAELAGLDSHEAFVEWVKSKPTLPQARLKDEWKHVLSFELACAECYEYTLSCLKEWVGKHRVVVLCSTGAERGVIYGHESWMPGQIKKTPAATPGATPGVRIWKTCVTCKAGMFLLPQQLVCSGCQQQRAMPQLPPPRRPPLWASQCVRCNEPTTMSYIIAGKKYCKACRDGLSL